jgi:MFS family permease
MWLRGRYTVAFVILDRNLNADENTADGPILSSAAVQLATEWEVSLSKFISDYNGVLLGCVAVSSLFGNSLAVKYGKRPVYLVTTVFLVVGSFWGAAAKSLGSLTGSRALVGLGV